MKYEMAHDVIEVFCTCAPEDQRYLKHLMVHLAPLQKQYQVSVWERSQILPGASWEAEFNVHVHAARILLFLVSPSLLNCPPCLHALQWALEERQCVVPVLLRSTSVQGTFLEHLQYLPRDGRPIVRQRNWDEAFVEITDEIKRLIWTSFSPVLALSAPRPTLPGSKDQLDGALQSAFAFMTALVEPKLAQFQTRARRHRRAWEQSLFAVVGSSGVTCLLALATVLVQAAGASQTWQALFAWVVFLAASASLVCVLMLLFSRLYEFQRWQHYQQRRAELSAEQYMYKSRRGIYALVPNAQQLFVERVFQIIQNAGEGTRSADDTRDYLPPTGEATPGTTPA